MIFKFTVFQDFNTIEMKKQLIELKDEIHEKNVELEKRKKCLKFLKINDLEVKIN